MAVRKTIRTGHLGLRRPARDVARDERILEEQHARCMLPLDMPVPK